MAVDIGREKVLFLTALMFLTRIPVPASLPYSDAILNASARYFPLVGALVGALGALVYALAVFLFPPALALLLAMAVTIVITGAFHEDGLADSCDGLGGGGDRARTLAIMKDSRVGTYGALALMLMLLIKFTALSALDSAGLVMPAMVLAHTWSRMLVVSYLVDTAYARVDETAKSKPMAVRLNRQGHRFALLTAAPFALLASLSQLLVLAVVLLLWRAWYAYVMRKRLGGYTGDLLGAAQQMSELLIYLVLVAV